MVKEEASLEQKWERGVYGVEGAVVKDTGM